MSCYLSIFCASFYSFLRVPTHLFPFFSLLRSDSYLLASGVSLLLLSSFCLRLPRLFSGLPRPHDFSRLPLRPRTPHYLPHFDESCPTLHIQAAQGYADMSGLRATLSWKVALVHVLLYTASSLACIVGVFVDELGFCRPHFLVL